MDYSPNLVIFIDVLNLGVFAVYTIAAIYVLVRLGFKTDFSVKVSILSFWLCCAARSAVLIYCMGNEPLSILADNYLTLLDINMIYISYTILYFLGYEMRAVYLKIHNNSMQEYLRANKWNKRLFMTLTALMLLMLLVRDTVEIL